MAGAAVWQLSGRTVPDLLIWFRDRPYVVEVKTGKGKQKPAQRGTPWPIVRSVKDALITIGAVTVED